MLVTNSLTTVEKKSLLNTFKALDTNGDGILSKEELIFGYEKILNSREMAEKHVEEIMVKLDHNFSGEIDYSGNHYFILMHFKLFKCIVNL